MSKKALIFLTSPAIGDMIWLSWMPKQLRRRCNFDKVDVFSRKANSVLWENNPHVNKIIYLEDYGTQTVAQVLEMFAKEYNQVLDCRFNVVEKYIKYSSEDYGTLEGRRKKAAGKCWYDVYDEWGLYGKNGELYLTQEEIDRNKRYRSDGIKRVLWQPMGSGRNKILVFMPGYVKYVAERFPNSEHWIMGSDGTPVSAFANMPNVKNKCGQFSVREAFTLVPIFDLVVCPDSSFMNVAGVFDVPCVFFGSISSYENLAKFWKYCTIIEPECDCFPCYVVTKEWRTIWDLNKRARARDYELGCLLWDKVDRYRAVGYKCCVQIDHKKAMDTIIGKMYDRNFKLAG